MDIFYQSSPEEYSVETFIEKYEHEMPQFVLVRRGYQGETNEETLDTGQAVRIHGIYSQQRVLAKIVRDSEGNLGGVDKYISIPVDSQLYLYVEKKRASTKDQKLLRQVISEDGFPINVHLNSTSNTGLMKKGKPVQITGDVRLCLLNQYKEKVMYGNPLNKGQLYRNVIHISRRMTSLMLSVITGLVSGDEEYWECIYSSMALTADNYIKFHHKGLKEVLECSLLDVKTITQTKPQTRTEIRTETKPQTRTETRTSIIQPQNMSKDQKRIETLYEEQTLLSTDEHVYQEIPSDPCTNDTTSSPCEDRIFKEISPVLDKSGTENNNHRSHTNKGAYVNIAKTRNYIVGEEVTYQNSSEVRKSELPKSVKATKSKDPKTKSSVYVNTQPDINTPSGSKTYVRCLDILPTINIPSDVDKLSVNDLGKYLHKLGLGHHEPKFTEYLVDGTILKDLNEEILIEEFGFKRFEAIKLMKFARNAHLPNVTNDTHL